MRARRRNRWLIAATVPAIVTIAAVPAGVAAATTSSATAAGGAEHQYVVFLKNQNSKLGARSAARRAAVRSEQRPVLAQLHADGAKNVRSTKAINAVIANVSAGDASALAANPAVALVVPNATFSGPTPLSLSAAVAAGPKAANPMNSPALCGTASSPQLNPQALFNIHAVQAIASGADGAGVKVAYMADGINPAEPDFARNAAFASAGSPAGSAVLTQADFSSDGANVPTAGGEAFLDASSIAAQGNSAFNLNDFVNSTHLFPSACYIKIQGDAPGATVLGLKVFAQNNDTTTSGFVQAIDYAVANGVKVINQSFGSNNMPDLTADAVRLADDAAVAAGVTVVVSTGDGGITSTIGSPATDPNVISVGATTTFRAYEQSTDGGINDPNANGRWVDNNISSLSSGGVSQAGGTVDLVAPGDENWALCDANATLFTDCANVFNGQAEPFQLSGGTSESAPLTSGAAADVIQAYAAAHAGTDPSPALVKQILMSTATDIDAPATQQGAGLLNIAAAVRLARSIGNSSASGGVLVSPGQVNVTQNPGASASKTISVTNTSSHAVNVNLATRALTTQVGSDSGTFCMQPGTPTASCPANTGVFPIWSGVKEVFQDVKFTVAATTGPSRLNFSADYQFSGQTSLLHFALLEPDGTYAGYSLPQGLADFANVQVKNPPAGTWTAVFFTEQNGATTGGVGTSGPIQWLASTSQYGAGSSVSPATLSLAAGQTGTAMLTVPSPATPGDTSESVIVSGAGQHTTIPVVIRTVVPTNGNGGSFSGVLTGGNGRAGTQAQANDYVFNVPKGAKAVRAAVTLANDPNDILIAQLIAPNGANLGYTTNVTFNSKGQPLTTLSADLYHAHPQAGKWTLILEWQNPVSGLELSEPFHVAIRFSAFGVHSNLPSGAKLKAGKTYTYKVTLKNIYQAPEAYFLDPRLNSNATISLTDQNAGNEAKLSLPLPAGLTFPFYLVPTQTSQLKAHLSSTVPVNFDLEFFPGDPDLEGVQSGNTASATVSAPEVTPGMWLLNPDEVGPYPATGAPAVTAAASLSAVTKAFDTAVTSSTGDLWEAANGITKSFTPVLLGPGASTTITVKIKVSGPAGAHRSGVLYVDDASLAGLEGVLGVGQGDELVAIPFSYQVK